eukprot:216144_1
MSKRLMVFLTWKQCSIIFLTHICIFLMIIQYRHTMMSPNASVNDELSQLTIIQDNTIHILLSSDEQDRLPMFTLINSIIINEMYIERLYFHILVLQNKSLFLDEFKNYFNSYLHQIKFEFKSIMEEHSECIEYSNIASAHIYKKVLNHPMNFARFCLPNVFKNVSIGIYLDVDMIVQNSISKLYDKYYNKYNYKVWR